MPAERFNPPPGWPLPRGWMPPQDWEPDPVWPAAPRGWQFWVEDESGAEADADADAEEAIAPPNPTAAPTSKPGWLRKVVVAPPIALVLILFTCLLIVTTCDRHEPTSGDDGLRIGLRAVGIHSKDVVFEVPIAHRSSPKRRAGSEEAALGRLLPGVPRTYEMCARNRNITALPRMKPNQRPS